MVITFRLTDGEVCRLAEHDSMSAASAVLPAGAYTTFRTYDGNRVLRLDRHLRRLEESVALLGVAAGLDFAMAREAIARAVREAGHAESRLRLTFAPPTLFISIEPFTPLPAAMYAAGVWCVTVSLRRENPHAKSTAFIASSTDAYRALPAGAHEGLMVGDDGALLEGLSSNFFAIVPDAYGAPMLRTEEARVLIGVTRELVLEVARAVLPVSTTAVRCDELSVVRECFITSVSREILPVVKIDQLTIGDGHPGPVTRELMRRFRELVQQEAEPLW